MNIPDVNYVACWTEDDGVYCCGHSHLVVREAMNCLVTDGGSLFALMTPCNRSPDGKSLIQVPFGQPHLLLALSFILVPQSGRVSLETCWIFLGDLHIVWHSVMVSAVQNARRQVDRRSRLALPADRSQACSCHAWRAKVSRPALAFRNLY